MTENTPLDAAGKLASFYRETILRHTANPVGFRSSIAATHSHELYNPLCGDRVRVDFELKDGQIEAVAFDGESCGICMASASILCACTRGHPITEVRKRHDWLEKALVSAEQPDANPAEPLQALLGVRRYPSRIKCALLPWQAALKALGI